MKKIALLIPALAIIISAPALAESLMEEAAQNEISVSGAYAYATSESQKNGAAFMEVANNTYQDIRLTTASTDISESVELHNMDMNGDKMVMRMVEDFEIEASTSLKLTPMSGHIMLMGLNEPLQEGGEFTLTLSFDNGEDKEVSVKIVAPGAIPEENTDGHDHDQDHTHHHNHDHDHGDHSHH
ncbi:MAG: copper chaperone PCu(A)C [Alphaproteobacteria bacterium]